MPDKTDRILYEYLVVRCRRRDAQAAQELAARFQRPLLYYLRRMLGSEDAAWEALQETWLAFYRGLGRLRDPQALPAYLYQIARNAALVQLRRQAADLSAMDTLASQAEEADDAADFSDEDAHGVHEALARLSLPHRDALTLFFLQDLSIDDIAAITGVPAGTVKSRLFHARRELRRILERQGVS